MTVNVSPVAPSLAFVLICALTPVDAAAHPAINAVIDPQSAVFFSDTRQVWRIAQDGTKSVAVPDVHTHELNATINSGASANSSSDPPLCATMLLWRLSIAISALVILVVGRASRVL